MEHDWWCQCNYVLTDPDLQYPHYFLREKAVPTCLCAGALSASDKAVLLKLNALNYLKINLFRQD